MSFTYASLLGTSNVQADSIEVSDLIIDSNYITVNGFIYYFPNQNDTLVTLTGIQTLSNKTLTSPKINNMVGIGGTLNDCIIGSTTPETGYFTTLFSSGLSTLNSLTVSNNTIIDGTTQMNGNLNVGTYSNESGIINIYGQSSWPALLYFYPNGGGQSWALRGTNASTFVLSDNTNTVSKVTFGNTTNGAITFINGTGLFKTSNNTLDNYNGVLGSSYFDGSMTVNGNITLGGTTSAFTNTYINILGENANYQIYVRGSSYAPNSSYNYLSLYDGDRGQDMLKIYQDGYITTPNVILDDGNGNMYITGTTLSITNTDYTQIHMIGSTTAYIGNYIVNGNLFFQTENASGITETNFTVNSTGTFIDVDSGTPLYINNINNTGTGQNSLVFQVGGTTVSQFGYNSVGTFCYDDSSGYIFYGSANNLTMMNLGSTLTINSNVIINGLSNLPLIINSNVNSAEIIFQNSGVDIWSLNGATGVGANSFSIYNSYRSGFPLSINNATNALTSLYNTLDDGSGNIIIPGNVVTETAIYTPDILPYSGTNINVYGTLNTTLGIYLPTSGGTATLFNYYEEYSQSCTFAPASGTGGTTATVTVSFVRIGSMIFMTVPYFTITMGNLSAGIIATGIPTRFYSSFNALQPASVRNNGTVVPGLLGMISTGEIQVSSSLNNDSFTSGTSNNGLWQTTCIAYEL